MDEIVLILNKTTGSVSVPASLSAPVPYVPSYLVNFDYSRRYDPVYYLHDVWNDASDPDVNGKPLMSGGPFGWISFFLVVIYWIRVAGPEVMRNKEPLDMKAWLLVLNGLTFGGYITGFVTGLVFADLGMQSFNCEACDLADRSVQMYIRKSTGYVFFGGKVWEFLRPLLSVYRKRDHEITNLYLLHCFASAILCWVGLKLYPGGVFTFLPYVDGFYQIFAYAYLVMSCASDNLKPSQSFRTFLYRLKIVSGIAVMAHAAYFLTQPNCGPVALKVIQLVYAGVGLCVGPSEYRKMEAARRQTQRIKAETKSKSA